MNNFFKYLSWGEKEENWGLHVITAGYARTEAGQTYSDLAHPSDHRLNWNKGRVLNGYYIIYISEGKGVFESENFQSAITAGTAFMLYPGMWHRYRPDKKTGWSEYWVGFNGDFTRILMEKNFSNNGLTTIELGFAEEFLTTFKHLLKTMDQAPLGYQQLVTGSTLQLLAHLFNAKTYHQKLDKQEDVLIKKAQFHIEESVNEELNIEIIAQKLSVGYSKFRKLFKEKTGIAPAQYHLNLRMKAAKELLAGTNLTITEIATQLGFQSAFYFSRIFHKKTGVSPKEFRMQSQNT